MYAAAPNLAEPKQKRPFEWTLRGATGVEGRRPASGNFLMFRYVRSSDGRPAEVSVRTASSSTDGRDQWPIVRQRNVADVSVGSACGVPRPPPDSTSRSVRDDPTIVTHPRMIFE
ncbi:hypothetical protein QTP88_016032 [Uroleucon formosanum]